VFIYVCEEEERCMEVEHERMRDGMGRVR
jgi:hypothetical protein